MTNLLKAAAAVSFLTVVANSAQAGTVYAQSVTGTDGAVSETCNVASSSTDRSDLCNALGEEDVDGDWRDGGFTSAGLYDSLLFDFGTLFSGPITIWEVTGGLNPSYLESVSFTLQNSVTNATATGVIRNDENNVADGPNRWKIEAKVAGLFDSLLIEDTTASTFPNTTAAKGDGFDIDAIAVNMAPVPVPASAALLLAGIGAFGAMRARKSA